MNYDDLSEIAWNDGWRVGYHKGTEDTEKRIAVIWAELATMNARIEYLEKLTGGFK